MNFIVFLLLAFIVIFVIAYRNNDGTGVYKYVSKPFGNELILSPNPAFSNESRTLSLSYFEEPATFSPSLYENKP